jgi:hypothetical protein
MQQPRWTGRDDHIPAPSPRVLLTENGDDTACVLCCSIDHSVLYAGEVHAGWRLARSCWAGVCGSGKLTRGHMDALNAIHGDIEPMINFLGLKNSPIWSVQPMT